MSVILAAACVPFEKALYLHLFRIIERFINDSPACKKTHVIFFLKRDAFGAAGTFMFRVCSRSFAFSFA